MNKGKGFVARVQELGTTLRGPEGTKFSFDVAMATNISMRQRHSLAISPTPSHISVYRNS